MLFYINVNSIITPTTTAYFDFRTVNQVSSFADFRSLSIPWSFNLS